MATGNTERTLRHAYADFISTFETFCRKEAARWGIREGRFHNIDHIRKTFRAAIGVDILAGLVAEDVRTLKRVFEKRHIHDHNAGIVSARYVEQVPEDASLLGKKAALSLQELESAARVLRRVLEVLVAAR